MAKRPEQSIEDIGESLLSQQAASRKEREKAAKKDARWLKILGAGVAGQSLVTSALKKRTQEIQDAGTISKLQSKLQVQTLIL